VISYDPAVSLAFIATYLRRELEAALEPMPDDAPMIKPLTIMSTRDIERISALHGKMTLEKLLAEYHGGETVISSFWDFLASSHKDDIDLEGTLMADSYRAALEKAGSLFFGEDAIAATRT
jgi:hypothetical protein